MSEFITSIDIAPTLAGLYLVLGGIVLKTDNFLSSLLFKVMPFVLGASCLITVAHNAGYIVNT